MKVIGTFTEDMMLEYLHCRLQEFCEDLNRYGIDHARVVRSLDAIMAQSKMIEDLTGKAIVMKLTGNLVVDGEEYK